MGLLPEASKEDIMTTKAYLEKYQKAKKTMDTFPDRTTEQQRRLISDIERSIALILDDDVRKIIEHRYVRGNSHKITVRHFIAAGWSERTVDRKIEEGLESIANTLIFCGQLDESIK